MTCQFMTAAAAVERWVKPSHSVAVGGMHMTSVPMSLVREILRQNIRIGRLLTGPSASLQAEWPLALGLVEELMSPYVGFEHLGLSPSHRRAVEGGQVRVLEVDEGCSTHAFYAGASGMPFIPCPPGLELTDIPRVNPECYREVTDPFSGETRTVIAAVRPDVMLLHCSEADECGNVAFGGYPFTDRLMAMAARRVIVQVERLVSSDTIARHPPGTTLPGFLVAAIVVAPGGCYPTCAPSHYYADESEIKGYLKAAKTAEGAREYIAQKVLAVDEAGYLNEAVTRLATAGLGEGAR